jgi:hypothetical protein
MPLASEIVEGGEEMTKVDQEEVEAGDIGVAGHKANAALQEEGVFAKVEISRVHD